LRRTKTRVKDPFDYVHFCRLPENADPSKITAKVENGVLEIDIPKKEQPKKEEPRKVQIDYGNK
jgi:HSP20 family molecular chaperone IbpA